MNILWYDFNNVFLEWFFKFVWLNKVVNWKKNVYGWFCNVNNMKVFGWC